MNRLVYSPCSPHLVTNPIKFHPLVRRIPLLPLAADFRRVCPVSVTKGSHVSPCDNVASSKNFHENRPSLVDPKLGLKAKAILPAATMFLMSSLIASPALSCFAASGGPPVTMMKGELLSSAWTGFMAGCLHTLSGPDHLAALTPLSIGRSPLESAGVGALWGLGHDAGQVIFGLLFVLLKDRLHIEILRTWGTRVVGCTLLAIGVLGIKEATEVQTPCVAVEGGDCEVSYYDSNVGAPKKKPIGFATFATGIVHGLQPDALMMILPALALPSRWAGAAFLVMFLVGTVVSMGSYTLFLSTCSKALRDRIPRVQEKLTWASSLIAIGLGAAILLTQCFGWNLY